MEDNPLFLTWARYMEKGKTLNVWLSVETVQRCPIYQLRKTSHTYTRTEENAPHLWPYDVLYVYMSLVLLGDTHLAYTFFVSDVLNLLSDYVILLLWLLCHSIINDHFSSFWGQIEHHPKCCTITACATSHNKSTSRTIAHNRRSFKQDRTELSYTMCEIEIRNQE